MIYTFKVIQLLEEVDAKIGEIISVEMKMSEYDQFVDTHPELERYIDKAPAVTFDGKTFGSDITSRQPDGFKEVLAKIGEQHTGSAVSERYAKNKTVKSVKTQEILKKYKEKSAKAVKTQAEKRRVKFA